MRKLALFGIICILFIGLANAESFPNKREYVAFGDVYVLFDGEHVPEFEGIFLTCQKDPALEQHPRFKVELYDEEKDCTWRPPPYADEISCVRGFCRAYDLPLEKLKIAIRLEFDTYITNEVDVYFAISNSENDYLVELFSNGSAHAEYAVDPDVSDVPLPEPREFAPDDYDAPVDDFNVAPHGDSGFQPDLFVIGSIMGLLVFGLVYLGLSKFVFKKARWLKIIIGGLFILYIIFIYFNSFLFF